MKSQLKPENGKMVIIDFKMTDIGRVEVAVEKQQPLEMVLLQCSKLTGIEIGGVIAVRQGQVITKNSIVEDGDEIDVFPAISGG
jgi:sulfur carrier protein ThiS